MITNIICWNSTNPQVALSLGSTALVFFITILGTEKLAEGVSPKLFVLFKRILESLASRNFSEEGSNVLKTVISSSVSSILDLLVSDEYIIKPDV